MVVPVFSTHSAFTVYVFVVLGLILIQAVFCNGGLTSNFVRKVENSVDMPLESDAPPPQPERNALQQVQMRSYTGKTRVRRKNQPKAVSPSTSVTIRLLGLFITHDTKYYYRVGIGQNPRTFWFMTPPKVGPNVPYTFGVIGDLGQTYDSNTTLTHFERNPVKGQAVLFVGDLSYVDNYPNHDNTRWDSWARFGETHPFKPFKHRYQTPYKASNSTEPFRYSIKGGPAYIIVLSSYSAYGKISYIMLL
ncbi:hypothetical protein Cgig2_002788 [Carnegiea gigantea]|uniref:Uncharacterized protein n=1 Tax=Carnegiea gigantea TaxID=171969 RepID=A0A9Q1QM61_9CARY|nr:hypothetical protein Cgig2_002788 [Carnegiea gigantea]